MIATASTLGLLCVMHCLTHDRPALEQHAQTDALTCNHGPRYWLDGGVLVIANCD